VRVCVLENKKRPAYGSSVFGDEQGATQKEEGEAEKAAYLPGDWETYLCEG